MTPNVFLLLNLVLAFYNAGTIWAHEVDIFRTWRLVNPEDFPKVQTAHWRKLPYWIFTPVGLALCGGVALVWYHPSSSPVWAIWANLTCQVLAIVLTAIFFWSMASQAVQGPAWLPESVPHEDSCDALDADAAHQRAAIWRAHLHSGIAIPTYVRFAPIASEVRHRSEMSRRANFD